MADEHNHRIQGDSPDQSDPGDSMLTTFVHSLTGLLRKLDDVKVTIEESSGKMPKVSSQLHSVTQATETATVEILNVLDGIAQSMAKAESGMDRIKVFLRDQPPHDEMNEVIRQVVSALTHTKESSMSIAMALQVQDITSQQIAGVLHMLESVRLELTHLVGHFSESEVRPMNDSHALHFDTDARYVATGARQEEADRIIQQWTAGSNG